MRLGIWLLLPLLAFGVVTWLMAPPPQPEPVDLSTESRLVGAAPPPPLRPHMTWQREPWDRSEPLGALATDGVRIFGATDDGRVVALSAHGDVRWQQTLPAGHGAPGHPYIGASILIPQADGRLDAFDPATGAARWTAAFPVPCSTDPVFHDGTAWCTPGGSGRLHQIEEGALRLGALLPGDATALASVGSTLAVAVEGEVILFEGGNILWRVGLPSLIDHLDGNGSHIVASGPEGTWGLEAGKVAWHRPGGPDWLTVSGSDLLVGLEGNVSRSDVASGESIWERPLVASGASIQGSLVLAHAVDTLHGLDPVDGGSRWTITLPAPILWAQPVGEHVVVSVAPGHGPGALVAIELR